ncbi:chitinase [Microbulbifer sp. GL-2]|uniref:chitinase n=1 Tax=Microbulbifer sp. GL-2 TaxID=2591606 RepID=UPI001161F8A2|nr:chitinase [Microbulbifer sp. GL-2]BBM02073.1 hypothetical protein GL2_21470 [Microbulbifer sp. GL-2]
MNHLFIRTATASALMIGTQGVAASPPAEDYVAGEQYRGGSQVCYADDLFKAQWWATPDQQPADALTAENTWDSPWVLLEAGACDGSGDNSGDSSSDDSGPGGDDPSSLAAYQPGQSYLKGSEVCYADDIFVAQWWANGDQAPAEALTVQNTWGSPWILKESNGCEANGNSGDGNDGDSASTPIPLSISASQTQVTGGGTLLLDANASGGDSTFNYSWAQLSPTIPEAEIASATSASTSVILPAVAYDVTYIFSLIVSDGDATEEAQVTVQNFAMDVGPDANSDSDNLVTAVISASANSVGCSGSVTLDGSRSSGGSDMSFIWSQTSGPSVKLSNYVGNTTQAVLPEVYSNVTYTFQLTATDSTAASNVDEVSISQTGCASVDGHVMDMSELEAAENALSTDSLLQEVKDTVETRGNVIVEAVQPGRNANPENVQRVESIISSDTWDYLFPLRAEDYTYTNFLRAVAKFPAFCGEYTDGRDSDAICRKALAVMFAHFGQETGAHATAWDEPEWRQGLYWIREIGWTEEASGGYGACDPGSSWAAEVWPCAINADGGYKSYFGRGSKQLSWNYNYGPFSQAMYGDIYTLLENPELVADTWLNLASAIFFFVYPQPPKPSMLHVVDGTWVPNRVDLANNLTSGFGVTTNIINGAIECSKGSEDYRSQYRMDYYQNFAEFLGVDIPADEELGCANMGQFQTGGSASLDIYWDKDWSWSAGNPNNKSFACQLVNYQTAYSALNEGDYARCVKANFDMTIDYQN